MLPLVKTVFSTQEWTCQCVGAVKSRRYLDDFESFLVVLGHFVSSDQLDVTAVAGVAHDVVLGRK